MLSGPEPLIYSAEHGMPQWKSILIVGIILLSLLPLYGMYRKLQSVTRPKESLRRFLTWLLAVLTLIFVYTFLLVLLIRLLFPGA